MKCQRDRQTAGCSQWVLPMLAGILAFTLILPLNANSQADPAAPCCGITAIDVRSGVVTGKVTATGRTFQFKLSDASQLRALKVGQAVAADFTTAKVTVRVAGAEPVGATLLP